MLTGSLLVPSLLKPGALWDKELMGCFSGMESESFCPSLFGFNAAGIPLQKKCKSKLVLSKQ